MIKNLKYIIAAALVMAGAASCVQDNLVPSSKEGEQVWASLNFAPQDNFNISTRATLSSEAEFRVQNLYIFVFDSAGNKVYGKLFENEDKVTGATALQSATAEKWWVSNGQTSTTGGFKIKARTGSGFSLYAIANLDADMVQISSDYLQHNIDTEAKLRDISIKLNQLSLSRNGYFPMTGYLGNLNIADDGTVTQDGAAPKLWLRRMDAKVKFVFKLGNRQDERGQSLGSFSALKWKVFNVPAGTRLIENGHDAADVPATAATGDYSNYAEGYFDSDWTNFEEFPDSETASFSFYMLENRLTPKNTPSAYQERSRQKKIAEGIYEGRNQSVSVTYVNALGEETTRDMRVFENANDFSTYVLVTGQVDMGLKDDDSGKVLGGDVQYLIHLGTWSLDSTGEHWDSDVYSGYDNFNTNRNTSYTYTVTINSVNNIRVEVETAGGADTENQPGATGSLTIAKEEIAVCDAHYVSKTMTFHASNLFEGKTSVADDLTWSVSTPFSVGEPENPEDPGTLDYQWIHFRLNKRNSDGTYSENRRKFVDPSRKFESTAYRTASENKESDGTDGLAGNHNDGLMDIIDLVKYMKEQASILEEYLQNPGMDYEGDFDNPDDMSQAKINITAFVDEYYYDKNPVTGVSSPTLWKKFVNQDDRSLHILCNSQVSTDHESRATGSVVTIKQHAIQSIYNTAESSSVQSAWGIEYMDEFADEVYTYNTGDSNDGNSAANSNENGLYNTVLDWGVDTTSYSSSWGTYMSFEKPNDDTQMQSNYKALRYICMTRNRDNNGDGVIDRSEMRWYTASVQQLIGLFVGSGVINHNSRLYNRSAAYQDSTNVLKWRQHVISSTHYSAGSGPTVIWGEEGISTGGIQSSIQWGGGLNHFEVRCVRNLGLDAEASVSDVPENFIKVTSSGNGDEAVYTYDCSNINSAALRYYTSRELEYHDQNSEMNRLYKKFEVAPKSENKSTGESNFKAVNETINTAINNGEVNPYCPEGYRTPNQLELSLMVYGNTNIISGTNVVSRTYWNLGVSGIGGKGKDEENKYGYQYKVNINLGPDGANYSQRCVRDVRD